MRAGAIYSYDQVKATKKDAARFHSSIYVWVHGTHQYKHSDAGSIYLYEPTPSMYSDAIEEPSCIKTTLRGIDKLHSMTPYWCGWRNRWIINSSFFLSCAFYLSACFFCWISALSAYHFLMHGISYMRCIHPISTCMWVCAHVYIIIGAYVHTYIIMRSWKSIRACKCTSSEWPLNLSYTTSHNTRQAGSRWTDRHAQHAWIHISTRRGTHSYLVFVQTVGGDVAQVSARVLSELHEDGQVGDGGGGSTQEFILVLLDVSLKIAYIKNHACIYMSIYTWVYCMCMSVYVCAITCLVYSKSMIEHRSTYTNEKELRMSHKLKGISMHGHKSQ